MINYHQEVASALNTVLPTYYELVLTSGIATPCISYMETNNYTTEDDGDTLGYSRITYQVKVWSKKIAEIQTYITQVDVAMRALGFKRVSAGELQDKQSGMIQKILSYEALASENY